MIWSLFYVLLFATAVMGAALPAVDGTMSNGERLARGLPPKSPTRRFNATAPRAPLSRRSNAPASGYIQADPVGGSSRKRGQPDTPFTTTSYLHYSSGIYYLTTNPNYADEFFFGESGANQYIKADSAGSNLLCETIWCAGAQRQMSPNAAGGPTAGMFTQCSSSPTLTVGSSYGVLNEQPVWTVPQTFPNPLSVAYLNYDQTQTTDGYFYVVNSDSFSNVLTYALQASDMINTNKQQKVALTLIAQLPA